MIYKCSLANLKINIHFHTVPWCCNAHTHLYIYFYFSVLFVFYLDKILKNIGRLLVICHNVKIMISLSVLTKVVIIYH